MGVAGFHTNRGLASAFLQSHLCLHPANSPLSNLLAMADTEPKVVEEAPVATEEVVEEVAETTEEAVKAPAAEGEAEAAPEAAEEESAAEPAEAESVEAPTEEAPAE